MKDVLLMIPAYNEAETIGPLLDRLHADPEISALADILVINDASSDDTSQIATRHGANVISHVFNLGYGSALQTGYKYAVRRNYRYVIQIDADGQHDICNVAQIYKRLTEPNADGKLPDIVIGSRFEKGSSSFRMTALKKLAISAFRFAIRVSTKKRILDPTSGLQGLNRRAFTCYSRYCQFDYKYPDANMIIQMLMLGYDVVEIPSVMHERVAGESMHSGILKPMLYMMIMPLCIFAVYFQLHKDKSSVKYP